MSHVTTGIFCSKHVQGSTTETRTSCFRDVGPWTCLMQKIQTCYIKCFTLYSWRYGLMRDTEKPSLADAIWNTAKATIMTSPSNREELNYNLDGDALIQRLPWSQNATFDSICNMHVDYVEKKYGNSTTIVFDGYGEGPSTEDAAHLRRSVVLWVWKWSL